MKKTEQCPLCRAHYSNRVKKTRHHVFPRTWYSHSTLLVEVCSECHSEFNHLYKMNLNYPWTKCQCLWNWINFCKTKVKDPFKVYPEIMEELYN